MTLDQLHPGDVLATFHDSGAFGAQMVFAKVLRVGRARVTVETENGRVTAVDPGMFHRRATPDEYGDSKPEWLPTT